jgi:hypothetical protein
VSLSSAVAGGPVAPRLAVLLGCPLCYRFRFGIQLRRVASSAVNAEIGIGFVIRHDNHLHEIEEDAIAL